MTLLGHSDDIRPRLQLDVVDPLQNLIVDRMHKAYDYDVIQDDYRFNMDCLRGLLKLFRSKGSRVICYLAPERSDVPPLLDPAGERKFNELFQREAKGLGVVVVDARQVVPNEYWGWEYASPDRSHFTEPGHQRLAQFLFEQIDDRHLWPPQNYAHGNEIQQLHILGVLTGGVHRPLAAAAEIAPSVAVDLELRVLRLVALAISRFAAGRGDAEPFRAKWIIAAGQNRARRGACMLAADIGLLALFKYLDWLVGNVNFVTRFLGSGLELAIPHWVLPLGISFYMFEAISYTVDVIRKREKLHAFWDFQLFIAFFPKLIAGPILRAKEFLPQIERGKLLPTIAQVREGLWLLASGLFLKLVLANMLGPQVDEAFPAP